MAAAFARAVAAATRSTSNRFGWHDSEVVGASAARYGADLRIHESTLTITTTPEADLAANERRHPMNLAARPVLERSGSYWDVREQALAALRQGNEEPDAFRVSRPYRVIEVIRPR